ncbi:Aste57867_19490 [Aphanomyces stellatus]|uniref:Aste57867_19490 protein n=1 Tax=Aphanomyces stellatus TaxID=120398 RepID=A0A485LDB1_9STRA|nr:hypothetical protein As57867_019426 [Aphanomyces stellatus]VFT96201.1 Aste57867_19490 [Aphanomyces stellatus]
MDTAAASIASTTILILAFDWIPTPLNRNILHSSPRDRLPSTLIHGTIGFLFAACLSFHLHWAAIFSTVWYAIVLVAALFNWWLPYVFGIHRGEITVQAYVAEYSDNLTLLAPLHKDHVIVPDVQHSLIHIAVVVSLVTSVAAIIAS